MPAIGRIRPPPLSGPERRHRRPPQTNGAARRRLRDQSSGGGRFNEPAASAGPRGPWPRWSANTACAASARLIPPPDRLPHPACATPGTSITLPTDQLQPVFTLSGISRRSFIVDRDQNPDPAPAPAAASPLSPPIGNIAAQRHRRSWPRRDAPMMPVRTDTIEVTIGDALRFARPLSFFVGAALPAHGHDIHVLEERRLHRALGGLGPHERGGRV